MTCTGRTSEPRTAVPGPGPAGPAQHLWTDSRILVTLLVESYVFSARTAAHTLAELEHDSDRHPARARCRRIHTIRVEVMSGTRFPMPWASPAGEPTLAHSSFGGTFVLGSICPQKSDPAKRFERFSRRAAPLSPVHLHAQ